MALNRLNRIGFNTSLANCLVKLVKKSEIDENGDPIYNDGSDEGNYKEVMKLYCFIDDRSFKEEVQNNKGEQIREKTIFVSRYFESISVEELLKLELAYGGKVYKILGIKRDESTKIDMEFECE